MPPAVTHYCWTCYATVDGPHGRCPACGGPIEPPAGSDYTDRLIWAPGHPLADRRMVAAHTLGERGDRRALPALRRLLADPDSHLAAAALEAVVRIDGVESSRDLLVEMAAGGPAMVRAAARRLLAEPG
jgi:HEAT repeat protein